MWSLFNWLSRKYERAVGYKGIILMLKVMFHDDGGRGGLLVSQKVTLHDEGGGSRHPLKRLYFLWTAPYDKFNK